MKVNDIGRLGAINSYQRQVENQRQPEDRKAKRKDELSISPEAMEMLKSSDKPENAANAKRIQELKAQVASGAYQVEAGKIAEKLAPYFKEYTK
ncbi:flagellar biosynthesis anti-sigma factor FlgM [Paenibacillus caui]|uniref:flagellar biosynthesis anti-sigma factor FlgM n=1 Tax=Paenibacillus caui TaxID=2873927 RepID=UPI001CAA2455|nr:flagellar biosynthesis anti-sigma factor FlgM [Paenibacillus caui]